jgi:hypothetical protein
MSPLLPTRNSSKFFCAPPPPPPKKKHIPAFFSPISHLFPFLPALYLLAFFNLYSRKFA